MKHTTKAVLIAVVLAGCPTPAPAPAAPAAPSVPAAPAAPGAPNAELVPSQPGAVVGSEPANEIKPVYAGNPTPNPMAARLCELFMLYPRERQAACCNATNAGASFAAECTRVVSVALAGGRVKLDAGKLAACETAYKKQLETCDLVMSSVSLPPDECQDLFQGALEPGAVCRSDLECRKGLTCVGLGPTDAGKCSAPAPAGAPCHTVVDSLAVYTKQSIADHAGCASYCNRTHCEDFRPVGAACIFDTQCGPKGRCSQRKCVAGAHVALGAACVDADDCALDAMCASGQCKPRGKTSAACTADDQCLGECDQGPGGGHCGPRCPHAFVPVFSKPQPAKH